MCKKILVVDDEKSIREIFAVVIKRCGFEPTLASDGEEAILSFVKNDFDMVFLDLKLPGMSGIETLRKLKKLNSDVPIYIVTGFHEFFIDDLKQLVEEGLAFEIIDKPNGIDTLEDVVRGTLTADATC